MLNANIVSIGVDLGGTWIRLVALDRQARRIRSLKATAPPLGQLPAFLKNRLRLWKARPPHLVVASRGIWTGTERAHLKRALRSLAKNVKVMSDVEAAWHAAFSATGAGIVVIAGTGSIAFGRDAEGCSVRTGGWGPLLGDEGSAFWMGKTWLHRTRGDTFTLDILKLARSPHQAVRRVAALAPRVLSQARQGNRLAKGIVNEAQQHLADLVRHAAGRLHFGKLIPVSWGGSLLNNPAFRAGFISALRRKNLHFQLISPGQTPALAIAKLKTSS